MVHARLARSRLILSLNGRSNMPSRMLEDCRVSRWLLRRDAVWVGTCIASVTLVALEPAASV